MEPLPVPYDGVVYAEHDDFSSDWEIAFSQWDMPSLEAFVTDLVNGRGPAKLVPDSLSQGSYNRILRFTFSSDGCDVALKFPIPGKTARTLWREKIANEAAWLQFLEEKTAVPVPHVYSSGVLPTALSLPYILMDWIPGVDLRSLLKDNSYAKMRPVFFRQVASIYLELYQLPLNGIGSIAKDNASGEWSITQRPLTMDMHQFSIGVYEFPTRHWPNGPLQTAGEYFDMVFSQHEVQLWNLRNINDVDSTRGNEQVSQTGQDLDADQVADTARRRYKARYGFRQLRRQFCNDECGMAVSRIFCPDIDPRNMLVDPDTGKITGLIDVEFTNAMPAQFAQAPPLWLFSILPAQCLDKGYIPWFQKQYEPRLDEFLDIMEQVERESLTDPTTMPLSSLMRSSWNTGSVWFNYAANHSDQVDSLYWEVLSKLHQGGVVPELPLLEKMEMEEYVQHTRVQLAAYNHAWDLRLKQLSD